MSTIYLASIVGAGVNAAGIGYLAGRINEIGLFGSLAAGMVFYVGTHAAVNLIGGDAEGKHRLRYDAGGPYFMKMIVGGAVNGILLHMLASWMLGQGGDTRFQGLLGAASAFMAADYVAGMVKKEGS